jgi:hypothetical protein
LYIINNPTFGNLDVMEGENSSNGEVARVAVRLPSFWAHRPASWFTQAEAQFYLAGISNELTQFYHVISQLDEKYVAEVDDIYSPPPRDPYTTLKTELIKRLCPSKDQRTRQLFEFEEMGDRKPSQFLRNLISLAPDIPNDYLRILWTSRLPTNIRTILAGLPEVELEAAALCADRIIETTSASTVASISLRPDHTELLQLIRDLPHQLATLAAKRNRSNSKDLRSHSSNLRSNSRSNSSQISC